MEFPEEFPLIIKKKNPGQEKREAWNLLSTVAMFGHPRVISPQNFGEKITINHNMFSTYAP